MTDREFKILKLLLPTDSYSKRGNVLTITFGDDEKSVLEKDNSKRVVEEKHLQLIIPEEIRVLPFKNRKSAAENCMDYLEELARNCKYPTGSVTPSLLKMASTTVLNGAMFAKYGKQSDAIMIKFIQDNIEYFRELCNKMKEKES